MIERTGLVTLQGNPLTLLGDSIAVGDRAPNCVAVDNNMAPVNLDAYKGKVVILSFVSSLDTAVCDTQTRRFNQEAASLGDDVVVLTVSMDLPFAQKRWCASAGIENVVTLSDYKEHCFGEHYGLLIKESGLLARAVMILDRDGIVRYQQIVDDIAKEPDYDKVLEQGRALL